jgi:hypothetical protein
MLAEREEGSGAMLPLELMIALGLVDVTTPERSTILLLSE